MLGQNGHTDPSEEFIPSHHFTAAWNGSRCKPKPTEGATESHELV